MQTLGQTIKIWRIQRGMQQQALSQATGLSQKYLSQIEHDHVDPRFSIIVRIARALDMPLHALMPSEEAVHV